jgi:hypothetical protein
MRIRIPWLPLWLGLVRGSRFAVALRPARHPSPRGWAPGDAEPPGIPGDGQAGGWPPLFRYQPY